MIVAGLLMILIGWLVGIPVLETLGLIVAVLGCILLLVRPGGRRYY